MIGLIFRHVVEQANGIDFQIGQGLGVLVHADDETLRLHRDRRYVTTDVQVALTVRRGGEAIDRTVHTVPWFNADARHSRG